MKNIVLVALILLIELSINLKNKNKLRYDYDDFSWLKNIRFKQKQVSQKQILDLNKQASMMIRHPTSSKEQFDLQKQFIQKQSAGQQQADQQQMVVKIVQQMFGGISVEQIVSAVQYVQTIQIKCGNEFGQCEPNTGNQIELDQLKSQVGQYKQEVQQLKQYIQQLEAKFIQLQQQQPQQQQQQQPLQQQPPQQQQQQQYGNSNSNSNRMIENNSFREIGSQISKKQQQENESQVPEQINIYDQENNSQIDKENSKLSDQLDEIL